MKAPFAAVSEHTHFLWQFIGDSILIYTHQLQAIQMERRWPIKVQESSEHVRFMDQHSLGG
jgi:hypothetical protein